MAASGTHSQPALFPRAGQELRVAGHSSLPPHSGISGPNHFQMAVGPLRSSSSNGGASMPVSSCRCSWRVCAEGGLWFRAKLCLLGTPPIPAQGSGSMLWGGRHWLVEDGSLASWAEDAQAQSLWALPTVAPWPGRGGVRGRGRSTTSSCFLFRSAHIGYTKYGQIIQGMGLKLDCQDSYPLSAP